LLVDRQTEIDEVKTALRVLGLEEEVLWFEIEMQVSTVMKIFKTL
jgi:hypothetical protein